MIDFVACVRRRDDRPPFKENVNGLSSKCGETMNSRLLLVKIEWESLPSILVTRNPNWSQRYRVRRLVA